MRLQRKYAPSDTPLVLVPRHGYRRSKRARFLRWAAVAFAVLLLVMVAVVSIVHKKSGPFARAYIVRLLEERYNANVELGKLTINLYPRLHAEGEDLIIRRRGYPVGFPPFISVRKFIVDADTKGLFR